MVSVPKDPICIRPVGVVVSDFKECSRTYDYNRESMIYMREDLTDTLVGVEDFSHIHVIYYQHRREEWLKIIDGEEDEQKFSQGVYTTRSPSRPSAMGSCVVELIKREGNRLYVRGLDALNGTPVMDIKVYVPQYDAFPLAQAPSKFCHEKKGE